MWILTETVFERSASVDIIRVSAGVTVTVESNNKLRQNRVSLKDIYVWGVYSTVTKHSDHFV